MTNQSTVRSDAQNPTETEIKVQVSTNRRRLIKGAATVAPMILTLRSGSALAQTSSCLDVVSNTQTFPVKPNPPGGYRCLNNDGTDAAFSSIDSNNDGTPDALQCNFNLVTASSAASLGANFCN